MKINLLHTWNVFVTELFYCTGVLVIFVLYLFMTGKGLVHIEHYSIANYLLYALFGLFFIVAPLCYNSIKWHKFRKDGKAKEGRSYIIVQVLLIVVVVLLITN